MLGGGGRGFLLDQFLSWKKNTCRKNCLLCHSSGLFFKPDQNHRPGLKRLNVVVLSLAAAAAPLL